MMIFIRRLYMCKLAGSSNRLIYFLFIVITLLATTSEAQNYQTPIFKNKLKYKPSLTVNEMTWHQYDVLSTKAIETDKMNGISYVISGSLALVGGLVGAGITTDPLEKGIYALFQTIGIASIGYGAYKWQVGDEQRVIMSSLRTTEELNDQQRLAFLKVYYEEKKELSSKERNIKAITHGLIAALNFYNASQQKQDGVKNTLYFVGAANMLASLSYTF